MLLTIDESISILNRGNIICVETDTIPGLAADAYNEKAIASLYALKNRDLSKKFVWMTHSIHLVEKMCMIPNVAIPIIEKYWPGALTIVVPIKGCTTQTLSFRIPNHPTLLSLLEKLQKPLAITSMNKSGESPIKNLEKIPLYIQKNIKGILKNPTPIKIEEICSTIVEFFCDETFQVLRTGTLKLIDLSSSSS